MWTRIRYIKSLLFSHVQWYLERLAMMFRFIYFWSNGLPEDFSDSGWLQFHGSGYAENVLGSRISFIKHCKMNPHEVGAAAFSRVPDFQSTPHPRTHLSPGQSLSEDYFCQLKLIIWHLTSAASHEGGWHTTSSLSKGLLREQWGKHRAALHLILSITSSHLIWLGNTSQQRMSSHAYFTEHHARVQAFCVSQTDFTSDYSLKFMLKKITITWLLASASLSTKFISPWHSVSLKRFSSHTKFSDVHFTDD